VKPNWYPKAIIFDMDGLLVDSEVVWEQAEVAMLAARGKKVSQADRERLVGTRMDVFLGEYKRIFNLQESYEELRAEIITRMSDLIPRHMRPQPGAKELVQFVVEQGFPCAIASSSPMEIIEAIVCHQGWERAIPVRCSADTVEHGKPAPDVYLKTAALLHMNPADCLALEDSPNGARAAVAADMICYAVPDPSHAKDEHFDGITPYVFKSLHEVRAQLIEMK
jgi:sugar-phosphatase